ERLCLAVFDTRAASLPVFDRAVLCSVALPDVDVAGAVHAFVVANVAVTGGHMAREDKDCLVDRLYVLYCRQRGCYCRYDIQLTCAVARRQRNTDDVDPSRGHLAAQTVGDRFRRHLVVPIEAALVRGRLCY